MKGIVRLSVLAKSIMMITRLIVDHFAQLHYDLNRHERQLTESKAESFVVRYARSSTSLVKIFYSVENV